MIIETAVPKILFDQNIKRGTILCITRDSFICYGMVITVLEPTMCNDVISQTMNVKVLDIVPYPITITSIELKSGECSIAIMPQEVPDDVVG